MEPLSCIEHIVKVERANRRGLPLFRSLHGALNPFIEELYEDISLMRWIVGKAE